MNKRPTVSLPLLMIIAITISSCTSDTDSPQGTINSTDSAANSPEDTTDSALSTAGIVSDSDWMVNDSNQRSIYIFEENSNQGVLINVESVTNETIDAQAYVRISASGIPGYQTVVDQTLLDTLAARPNSITDFINGSPDLAVGDIVEYGQNIGYLSSDQNCNNTGGYGYWPPGPGCPQDTDKSALFTTTPVETTEECATGLGAIGYFVNGVSIYDWNDGQSYQSEGTWQHTAANAEIHDLDICLGHAANSDYHHHNWSTCLAEEIGDTGDSHSPVYGQAADGYPVHGPWHASNILVQSSWVARNYDDAESATGCGVSGARTCVMVDPTDVSQGTIDADNDGPTTSESIISLSGNPIPAVSGLYFQDWYNDSELTALGDGYLDEHNGHDHDGIGYHYHLTITDNGDNTVSPAFPFTFGPTYKGILDNNALASCGTTDTGPGGRPPPQGAIVSDAAHGHDDHSHSHD